MCLAWPCCITTCQHTLCNALQGVLTVCRRRICALARVSDFSMSDLYEPEPRRTNLILSALINACQFAEERQPLFDELRRKSELAYQEHEEALDERAELKAKIAAVRCANDLASRCRCR